MPYSYWLPDSENNIQEYCTESNAVVLIGANGAGKSKLGAWIEQQNYGKVHRIGAQRNLSFSDHIDLKSYSDAENLLQYGTLEENYIQRNDKSVRWDWGKYTTILLNDYENVLAALIAKVNNEQADFYKRCQKAELEERQKPDTEATTFDKLTKIWDDILPHRKLILEDSRLFSCDRNNSEVTRYSATEMSDGERSVLYLAAQVLCMPKNRVLIIDEPELHLHRAIMMPLWDELEKCRDDCLFIYITHDTQFISSHRDAEKIWVKKYDGQNWEWEFIEDDLPEELFVNIIGSRKKVLFIEGEKNSYDYRLYSEIFPDYYVVPCGSCSQVISRTKVYKSSPTLHECTVTGIIDRDYRTDYELNSLEDDGVYAISVAEVDNLFAVEEVVRIMANHMEKNENEVFNSVKQYVVNDRFSNQIDNQILDSAISRLKFELSNVSISHNNKDEAKQNFEEAIASIDFDEIIQDQSDKYQRVLESNDYSEVLSVFNEKSISKSIGHFMDVANDAYCDLVISLLRGDKHEEIKQALSPYLPTAIAQ